MDKKADSDDDKRTKKLYRKTKFQMVTISFSRDRDRELLEYLSSVGNKSKMFHDLLAEKVEKINSLKNK